MFTAPSGERSHHGASRRCGEDVTGPGSKVKKKAHSPEVTLPALCCEPPSLSQAIVTRPLFSYTPVIKNVPCDKPSSVVGLPPLTNQAGPGKATTDTKWTEGLMTPALWTYIPIRTADNSTTQSLSRKDEAINILTREDKKLMTVENSNETKPNKVPLTGTDVVHILASKRDLGEPELYYLKEVDRDSYRPYDLQVVHPREAGSEHYIFSPHTVIHVTESGYGGLVRLAEWYREYTLWTALQKIPFFRNFRLQKAITRWHQNVRKTIFQRRSKELQKMLIVAVPQFRSALFLFTRVLEELKGTHHLPQEESRTYTLLEFRNELITLNQERLQMLEELSQCRAVILNTVKEGRYKAQQELQLHMEYAKKPHKIYEPIHLHLAHQQELKKELAWSESVLKKLGNFAALINQMTVQNLVTIIHQDTTSFFSNVLKREKPQQCCLFHIELCFSVNGQLTLDPPVHQFQEAVSEALLTVGDSTVQMCETCGFFREISSSVISSDFAQNIIAELHDIEHATTTGENESNEEMTGRRKFCCWMLLTDLSSRCPVPPEKTSPMVQGSREHGCFCPLPRKQLEWQISVSDVTKQVEEEQNKIMQEAEVEIKQLCERYSWLMDIHVFISQWSQVSLELLIGQPADLYEEHIKKVHHWVERISTVPSLISTSNQLFIIHCTHMKENLVQQLKMIEKEVLEQLVEQIKLHSQSVRSDMERATAELKTEPQDLHGLSKYAVTVRESVKLFADSQKRLEYIQSLQDSMSKNYRKMTEQEETLEEKITGMLDSFIPLLKQADSIVCHCLPSMSNAVDTMFSFLVCDLKNVVSKTTSGPFLDPTQNAKEMVSSLNYMCAHVHSLNTKLEQLSRNSQNLREHQLDLAILTADVQRVYACKELWELKDSYTTWLEGWKQLPFSEMVVSQDQERIAKWEEQALSLAIIIPTHDAVLQETLRNLENIGHQLDFMGMLQSPLLKHKHWEAIFAGMGLSYVPEKKVTVAELMSNQLEIDLKLVTKTYSDAQAECDMEQTFHKLQQEWEDRLFQLEKFTLPNWQLCEPRQGLTETEKTKEGTVSNLRTASHGSSNDARFIIIGLEIHFSQIENDLMTLSIMLNSPHSAEFRLQIEKWVQSLQDLEKLLNLFERYQKMWAFLTKLVSENFTVQKLDLLEQFQPVDETFKEIMHATSSDPHVLNFVQFKKTNNRFHGNRLCQILIDGLSTMESISNQFVNLMDTLCEQFPRLWVLSDKEMVELLSFDKAPLTLQPFVRKCFKGVHGLKVDCETPSTVDTKNCESSSQNAKVLGIFGSLQEHITFLSPLEPNLSALLWLCVFEKQFKLTMLQLMKQCAVVRNQLESSSQDLECEKKVGGVTIHIADRRKIALPVLDLLSEYPLECVLVAEEAVWYDKLLQAFHESSPVKLSSIKVQNSTKLRNLGCSIRDGVKGAQSVSQISKYSMMCLRALVQLTMNRAQQVSRLMEVQCVPLESSFEWLSLMKYHINSQDWSLKGSDDPTCYVDVLGHRLQYDYEYSGPEEWAMVHTPSTDRVMLGILLALTGYRCAFVNGSHMSGKKTTVVQLGKALGRQVVSMQCSPSMRPRIVQQMLLGALQTGAWLLLDSVDLLTEGVLSLLGQQLLDIHQLFSGLTRNKTQRRNEEPKDRTAETVTGCKHVVDSDCQMVIAGKSITASLSYGCVLISSKVYTSEAPESLRYATRPIALTHPDYRIIAEVMLTSIGFTEAMSLSQRLVSLISLAKDSLCLPGFLTDDQSCYLVVLKKIISAAEIHYEQSVRQQEITHEAKGLAAEKTDLASAENTTARVIEKNMKEAVKHSRLCHSRLSIIEALMEETAIVKAILSVLLPVLYEQKKASQFYSIFKDAFPIACQFPHFRQYLEEEENSVLKDAVAEELQRKQSHPDNKIICSALTLYQTMKLSQAVVLIGPSGSGKTTCYCALAGALCCLAARSVEYVFENGKTIEGTSPQAELQTTTLTWKPVNSVVLFPNAMSHEELFGYFCEKRGWQEGAVAKVVRDSVRHEPTSFTICNKKSNQTPIVKWLVMDGEPTGQPGWLDYLTTLCTPEDPYLCLPSGETLPSQSNLKLLIETPDLRDASPSAVTCCSLVHFRGTDLWKAVWKSELDALSYEHKLDQGTLKLWERLAEDLFCATLSLIRQEALTSAIHNEGRSLESLTYGLQEITSFIRILRALLHHVGREEEKAQSIPQIDKGDIYRSGTAGTDFHTKQELLLRNLFLVAYIWGFGGHLHPRHWPQFDLLAREVLFTCRYKIVVPDEESVFDHFFNINSKICPKNTLLTNFIAPKNVKYTYLLNLMLEANQPVLLAGEPGSGKTTLCKTLLSFDRPHISVPASPLLSSRNLRTILDNVRQKNCKDTVGSMTKKPGLLLFVDDLHEAPFDVYGKTSAALETLRQGISMGEILTFDTYHFKLLNSETISYMATCCIGALRNHQSKVITPRLSRLFSTLVLPTLSMDMILSIHSPRLKIWLKDMPLRQSFDDMACCIIAATKSLYDAICDQFQPTEQRPLFIFSQHDLQKVFRGMCLWQPNIPNTGTMQKKPRFLPVLTGPTASALNIAHLWMHECMRTFSDRLYSEDESQTLVSLIAKTATTYYGVHLIDETQPISKEGPPTLTSLAVPALPMDTATTLSTIGQSVDKLMLPQEPKPIDQSDRTKDQTLTEPSLLSEDSCSEVPSLKSGSVQPQILQHMEVIISELLYGPNLPEASKSLNEQHNFRRNCSYQDQDLAVLLQELFALVDSKRADNHHNVTTRCIVHSQRVSQLLHILRVLLIPGGHGVLIGSKRGTGRKTTVRLAACITGYQLMEVHPENEDKLHEILKEAGNQTRVDGVHVIILVHEGIGLFVREKLLVAMAHRTYPGLHTETELRNLVSKVTAVKNSRKYLMDSWLFNKSLSQIHRNVHVFLMLPLTVSDSSDIPANNTNHAWNAQLTKAVTVSCCVEVYHPWSNQSLVEVAAQYLKSSLHKSESHHQTKRKESEAGLPVAMAAIHQCACQHASDLLQDQPFSPQTYIEFISHFGYLYNHLHEQRESQADRVATVLSGLEVMNNTAVQYKQHRIKLQEKVAETRQEEEELLRGVDYRRSQLEEARDRCAVVEKQLYDLEQQINHAQEQVRPVFLSALKIHNCLNPSDLEEVRHYREPPDGVVKIMDAICLLFNRPPGWENAKQLLGQSNFFQELEFFDRYTLTDEQMQQLAQIVQSPQFVPESVQEVSKACESLCRWVQAVYECCCMKHRLLVKQQLEVLAKEVLSQLQLAKQHMEATYHHLEDVKFQLQLIRKKLEGQLVELQTAESAEREATSAARQVEIHISNWRAAAQEAELNKQTLPGDALILAAIISYLGPFGPDVRTELLSKWRELFQTGSININPKDPRTSLFTHSDAEPSHPHLGFPIAVSERLQLPLGQALGIHQYAPSATVVVKLLLWGFRRAWVQCWPLLVDTQQRLEIWSKSWFVTGEKAKLETEAECEMVVSADDPELLDKLDQAAEKGLRVLVTNMERAMPSSQFLARLVRPAGCHCPGLKQHVQPTHPDFFLFLSTNLPAQLLGNEIHPSILAQVRVVDLSLSSEEIQELMLTQLLQSECKKLLTRHLQLQNDKESLQEKLVPEEDALMDYILQTNTSWERDPDFLPRVAVCQEAMAKMQTEILQLREELDHQESLLAVPRQLMKLAAALYQALQEVSRLSPAYYFSLRGFITVMKQACIVKGRPLTSYTSKKVSDSIIAEVTNRMIAQLLVQYRPCLTKSHVDVLKMLVSVALLQHNQLCSEAERMVFLRGLHDIDHPVTKVNLCSSLLTTTQSIGALPSWIPSRIHPELLCLEKIPAFRGLIASLSTYPTQWQEYLHRTSSSVAGAVPCRSHSHLSLLQRALLWKTVSPDCLKGLSDAMAVYSLCLSGQTAENEAPHTGNLEALSRYLIKHEGPIILTMPSPREVRCTSIQPLHLINSLADCVAGTKEVRVKVISIEALCDTHAILSTLDKAVNDGHWLVFNNCHLLERWDQKVLSYLNWLISSFREERCLTHPAFQLWFVTQEYASCCLPAAVRMCALPLVCDSPLDLKEELNCSLQQVESVIRCRSLSGVMADDVELLLRCAIFHSVLLQRQAYKYLGQGKIYSWNQEDLLVLMDAHSRIASLCHDKTRAVQDIAVNLVHGGHVLDSADLEVVENAAKTCFSTVLPLRGKGPHILADVISNLSHIDLTGLRQMSDQALQDSVHIDDPLVLGFSTDVAAEIIKIDSCNLNILLQASQSPLGTGQSFCTQLKQPVTLPDLTHARDRLQALKTYLKHQNDSADTNAGAVSHSPLRDFLHAEWDDLIDSVSSLLSQLQQPVQYSTPAFTSLLKLTDLSHLERRAELLSAYLWHHNTSDPPGAYRLSAFSNARGFLVAMMRQAAQINRKYISDIALHFQVLSDSTYPASLPVDAVYLCGLELRGASWDRHLGALQDSDSSQPRSLPLVYAKAQVRSNNTARNASPGESLHLKDSSNVEVANASSVAPQLPLYHCPVYLDGERESGNWGLADVNIITTLPLPAKLNPVLCSLRRVRLVSVL